MCSLCICVGEPRVRVWTKLAESVPLGATTIVTSEDVDFRQGAVRLPELRSLYVRRYTTRATPVFKPTRFAVTS